MRIGLNTVRTKDSKSLEVCGSNGPEEFHGVSVFTLYLTDLQSHFRVINEKQGILLECKLRRPV